MGVAEFVLVLTELVLGAVACFLAILVWSRTREASWVLLGAGVIASYAAIVFDALKAFGIVGEQTFVVSGFPIGDLVASNLPTMFFVAAFAAFLVRSRIK